MRAASKRYGIITGVYLAACVAVMGLFYGTVLRPQNRQWDGLRQELTDLTQQFDQAQQCRTEQSRTRMQTQLAALRNHGRIPWWTRAGRPPWRFKSGRWPMS
jgi:hypothetical protein